MHKHIKQKERVTMDMDNTLFITRENSNNTKHRHNISTKPLDYIKQIDMPQLWTSKPTITSKYNKKLNHFHINSLVVIRNPRSTFVQGYYYLHNILLIGEGCDIYCRNQLKLLHILNLKYQLIYKYIYSYHDINYNIALNQYCLLIHEAIFSTRNIE